MPPPVLLPEERDAELFLRGLGLEVRLVPTSASKTPDFLVDGDARGYVLEVKARFDSEDWSRAIENGNVAYQKRSMSYGRWAEDVASEALKQFSSADREHSRWWVLWLSIRCQASAQAMSDEAVGSLFGVRQVVYRDPCSQQHAFRDCLFARPGVFERHSEIVASVVACGDGLIFCVNEFAEDFGPFRESVLNSRFSARHPPTSATDLCENRGFFRVSDPSLNRKDDAALAAYLKRKYRLESAMMLNMQAHSVSMAVPRAESD